MSIEKSKLKDEGRVNEPGSFRKVVGWFVSPRVFIKKEDMKYGVFSMAPIKNVFMEVSASYEKLKRRQKLVQQGKTRTGGFSDDDRKYLKEELSDDEFAEVTHHTFNYERLSDYLADNNIPLKAVRRSYDNNAMWGYLGLIVGSLILVTGMLTLLGLFQVISPIGMIGKISGGVMIIIALIQYTVSLQRFYQASLIAKRKLPEETSFKAFLSGDIHRFPTPTLSEEFDHWYEVNVRQK